jgi:hypothetical protein
MHMRQKDDYGGGKRKKQKSIPDNFVFPKNKGDEERQAGVPGKKQISAKCYFAQEVGMND